MIDSNTHHDFRNSSLFAVWLSGGKCDQRTADAAARRARISIGCLLLSVCAATVASSPGDPIGPPIVVNDAFQGPVDRGGPQVRARADGGYAVLWKDGRTQPHTLSYRTLAADGTLNSAQMPVSGAVRDGNGDQIAVNASGVAVVVWLDGGGTTGRGMSVYARRFGADGLPLEPLPILVADPPLESGLTFSSLDPPSVAISNDGDFIIAWRQTQSISTNALPILTIPVSERIVARRYSADGSPQGAVRPVGGLLPVSALSDAIRIAVNEAGDFVVVYRNRQSLPFENTNALPFPYEGRLYRAGGIEAGVPIRFTIGGQRQNALGQKDFAVTFTTSGDLMLAWTALDQRFSPTEETLLMRRFSPHGNPRGDTVTVARRAPFFFETSLSLAPLPAGGVAIVWPDRVGNTPGTAYGRFYAADDSALGEPFTVATGVRTVSADTDAVGNVIAVYGESDIFARVFQGP